MEILMPSSRHALQHSLLLYGILFAVCWPVVNQRKVCAEIHKTTYTYKRVGSLEIKADVYRVRSDTRRPVVVWIHGGALINGHREGISRRLKDAFLKRNDIVVSIDYRLAPETQLPAIIQDVEDAFHWIRTQGPELFGADPNRIAVVGGSAGGYLTLVTGFRVKPRPTVLVALWGYGDLVGDWYSTPSPHPRHQRVKMSREESWKQVSGPPISDSRLRQGNGGAFYQFCRRQGEWPQSVSGWDPRKERDRYLPYMPVAHVTPEYPPTLLIHGQQDTDVPHEQSVMMAVEFRRHKVPHKLISIPRAEHGLSGGAPARIEQAYEDAIQFIQQRLDSATP
jgi:acetyl esterase/lipase